MRGTAILPSRRACDEPGHASRRAIRPAYLALLAFIVAGLACAGCDRPPPAAAQSGPQAAAAAGQTLRRLLDLRAQRQYTQMPPLIVPACGHQVVGTLAAVDEFLDANRRLCDWVRDHVGVGLAQTVDQSYLGDNLGVFSRHVELLDAVVVDDQATVSFTVDGRLPARTARLRRFGDAWRYDPEGGYSDDLPAAFRDMARGLDNVRIELERAVIPVAELRNSPERLVTRVKTALHRGVALLSKARAAGTAPAEP